MTFPILPKRKMRFQVVRDVQVELNEILQQKISPLAQISE